MRILFVLTYYSPHWTGLTQYAARLAERLAKSHHVEVLCVKHQKDLLENEVINGVKVIRLPYSFKFIRSLIAPGMIYKLYKLVQKNNIVVIYLPFLEILPASILVRFLNKKLYLVHNGDLVLPDKDNIMKKLVEKFYFLSTAFAIKLSNRIIIQTEDYANNSKLLSRFKNKWSVILPLYDSFETKYTDIQNYKKTNNLVGYKLVGFSGRFVEEKGVDYLLKAIPKVISKVNNAMFLLAGETRIKYENFWSRIEKLVDKYKDRVVILGLIENSEELARFYSALDVLVQPSRTDCFPSSQVEAILLGTPVVCTNIPGARWVVKKTRMGVLVKPRSSIALANGIIEVLDNKGKYIRQEDEIKKIFDYDKTLGEYGELFKN